MEIEYSFKKLMSIITDRHERQKKVKIVLLES